MIPQTRLSTFSTGAAGVMSTTGAVGAVLLMVTVLEETAVPLPPASAGVARQ